MGEKVWLLWFEQEREEGEDTELLIGVYRTEETAKGAIMRLQDQAGFREYPEGFHITHGPWTRIHGRKDSRGYSPYA